MTESKMTVDIGVLDKDICSRCGLFELAAYPMDLYGDNKVVAHQHVFKCANLRRCSYLRNLFRTAKETTPVIEDKDP